MLHLGGDKRKRAKLRIHFDNNTIHFILILTQSGNCKFKVHLKRCVVELETSSKYEIFFVGS